ncbi:MAG TPA: hypothetical protein VK780_04175 [Thermoanaerobaculia bacterium]|jgi:hypothetical protein|nr:hypothetical protein [Thermoanaerobaculia bacterium]
MSTWKENTIRNWSPRAFLVFVLLIGAWEGSVLFQHSGLRLRADRLRVGRPAADRSDFSSQGVPATVVASERNSSAPRVRMKRPDGPGLIAISGSGWQPGETVSLVLRDLSQPGLDQTFSATADAAGEFFNDQFSPDVGQAPVTFLLTALGNSSGLKAQARFTDRSLGRPQPCAKTGEEDEGPCLSTRPNQNRRSSRPFVVGARGAERFRLPGGHDRRTWCNPSSLS